MASHKFNPLEVFLQLEPDLQLNAGPTTRAFQFRPSVDMYETASGVIVKMELPGVKPEQLAITLSADDRKLMVTGERREAEEEHAGRTRCYHLEIYYGTFEREVMLPADMRFDRERITANYHDGFLVISLPKRMEKRTIEVKSL